MSEIFTFGDLLRNNPVGIINILTWRKYCFRDEKMRNRRGNALMRCIARYTFLAVFGLWLLIMPAHATLILKGNSNSSTLDGSTTGDTVLTKDKLSTPNQSFNVGVPSLDVPIAQLKLTLNPNAIGSQLVDYDLILTLTKPTADVSSIPIVLSLSETGIGTSSLITISGFSSLTDVLLPDHIVLSDFRFDVTNTGIATGSFDNSSGTWTIGSNNGTSTLLIAADVSVPEPSSMALLGTGLMGLGLFRRFRRRRGATHAPDLVAQT